MGLYAPAIQSWWQTILLPTQVPTAVGTGSL
eukprot:SAG11_NODE_22644_length_402_cov_2.673267_1_plen_30_part_10